MEDRDNEELTVRINLTVSASKEHSLEQQRDDLEKSFRQHFKNITDLKITYICDICNRESADCNDMKRSSCDHCHQTIDYCVEHKETCLICLNCNLKEIDVDQERSGDSNSTPPPIGPKLELKPRPAPKPYEF